MGVWCGVRVVWCGVVAFRVIPLLLVMNLRRADQRSQASDSGSVGPRVTNPFC